MKSQTHLFFRSIMLTKIFILLIILLNTSANAQNTAPGIDIIGRGYDIFGEYANNNSKKKYSLFVFPQSSKISYDYNVPEYLILENISDHRIKQIEGSSLNEYADNMEASVNLKTNALLFSASVEAQFGKNTSTNEEKFYYTYMDANTKWRISIDMRNIDILIEILEPQFKLDLATMTPQKLFDTYGTHFIASAYIGGRADFSTNTVKNTSYTTEQIKSAVKGRFATIKGEGSYSSANEINSIIEKCETKLRVVGGNSEYANNISDNPVQYQKWAEGIKDRPVLCDFDSESLIPIWKLTNDTKRKEILEKYFTDLILIQHPKPEMVKPIIANYEINLYGIYVVDDCETALMPPGEFQYSFSVNVNGKEKYTTGKQSKNVYEQQWWMIEKKIPVSFHYKKGTEITINCKIIETDDIGGEHDYLQPFPFAKTYSYPFSTEDLYNYKESNGSLWNKYTIQKSDLCKVVLYYQIYKIQNPQAVKLGNEGWKEYENGNYDFCVKFSKQALEIDNSLLYVHFNIALVHLIKGDPIAKNLYKNAIEMCGEKYSLEGALIDINDYEAAKGKLSNSEEIKSLLKIKIAEL
ncbi:MAG: hypothetical protein HYU68_11510 [Bacteroidetes bacterium]|nr:hypothetical protein [Bacteroidota bacterium]